MKRDGKYRFSLQFGSETREQMQAGELLERLGNRKSAVVIAALNAYITAHPELAEPAPVSVKIDGGIRRDALEQMIRSIITSESQTVSCLPEALKHHLYKCRKI